MAVSPRMAAFSLLLQQQRSGSYSNLLLEKSDWMQSFDARDRAFVTTLFYGVIERLITLDYNVSLYLQKPLKKLQPEAVVLLRLGAYQILFLQSVPASAAVNESVKLAKQKCRYAAGLINAVLRKVANNGLCLPPESNYLHHVSVKYSCPEWLVNRWLSCYGKDDMLGILESSLQPAKLTVRVNTVKTNIDALQKQLLLEGVESEPLPVPDALSLKKLPCALDQLPSFRKGFFHVQDKASMLCALAVDAKPGQTVYDLCASPGGKSFTIAETMENRGVLRAYDLYEKRAGLIAAGAQRLGLNCIATAAADASQFDPARPAADRVLCDVPCSGLGILRQKPEVKYKDPTSLQQLPEIQQSILQTGARYVKNGGRLVYSTCALEPKENEQVCEAFLRLHPDFFAVPPLPALSDDCFLTLMPHKLDCDGFFIAAFQKRGNA